MTRTEWAEIAYRTAERAFVQTHKAHGRKRCTAACDLAFNRMSHFEMVWLDVGEEEAGGTPGFMEIYSIPR